MTRNWNDWVANIVPGARVYVRFRAQAHAQNYSKLGYIEDTRSDVLNMQIDDQSESTGGRIEVIAGETPYNYVKYFYAIDSWKYDNLIDSPNYYFILNEPLPKWTFGANNTYADDRAFFEYMIAQFIDVYGVLFIKQPIRIRIKVPNGIYDLRFKIYRNYDTNYYSYNINGKQYDIIDDRMSNGEGFNQDIENVMVTDGWLDITYETKRWGGLESILMKQELKEWTDWTAPIIVVCTTLEGEKTTDWSDYVSVDCVEKGLTEWSDEVVVECREITEWSDEITVVCRHVNTKEMYEEMKSKHLGNREWQLDHYVDNAKILAIIKEIKKTV